MNLRFVVDLAEENYYAPDYYGFATTTQATYGFCPRVDELQAFNLTYAARFMAMSLPTNVSNATMSKYPVYNHIYAYGLGDIGSINVPTNGSYGRALVIDNKTDTCPFGSFAIAKFLIMNVSLDNGKFRYFPDESPQPQGTGFVPTCDGDVCMFDQEAVCIGETGRKNCATCYSDTQEIADLPIQIWVSYYGTDTRGRVLRSGANNPMNFRSFSGSGVYASVGNSVDRLKAGKTSQDDQLEP
jgi:hypothetical protein